jgi:hypothetical protein
MHVKYFLKQSMAKYFCQSGALRNIVQNGKMCLNELFHLSGVIPLGFGLKLAISIFFFNWTKLAAAHNRWHLSALHHET